MLQNNKPDAARLHHKNMYERERRVLYRVEIGNIGKSFSYHPLLVVVLFFGGADFDFFFCFENAANCR